MKTPIGSFYMSAAGSMLSLDEPYLPEGADEQPRAASPPQAWTGLRAVDRGRPRALILDRSELASIFKAVSILTPAGA